MSSSEIITAKNLTKIYGNITVVDGISFSIFRGECYGFLGPNGAGKTTTIKMVHCFSPLTSGELVVGGMNVNKDQRKIKEIIGVVPQEENLDPDLSVFKNLTVYARYFNAPRKEAEKRAVELLDFIHLNESMIKNIKNSPTTQQKILTISTCNT